jgi:putative alpha-1,2-mannosidase
MQVNTQLAVSTKQAQNRKEYIKEAQWAKEQIDEKNAREFVS